MGESGHSVCIAAKKQAITIMRETSRHDKEYLLRIYPITETGGYPCD